MSIVSTKQMCRKIANFYLLHGVKSKLEGILLGEELTYVSLSDAAPAYISEIDGSIAPYAGRVGKNRFHLAEDGNRVLGIVDMKTNRFYRMSTDEDPNLEIAKEFVDLMRKEELTEEEKKRIRLQYVGLPICEWASATAHDLFKLTRLFSKTG